MALKGKTLTSLVALLRGIPQEDIEATIRDADALEKAGGGQHAETADGGTITDHWQAGQKHVIPSREQIKTGPGEHSSGGGAEKMVGEYSNPAPQKGVQVNAEKLGELLEDWGRTMKSMQAMHDVIMRAVTFMVSKAGKDDDDDEEEEEVVEINEKAKRLLEKAKKLITAAAKAKEEADDEEGPARKAKRLEARQLRKSAAKALGKAQLYARAGRKGTVETRAAIKALLDDDTALKAEIEIEQEEEEDEEEDKKSRAAAAAATAAASATPPVTAKNEGSKDGEGNQAAKQDGESKNQDDSAKKAMTDVADQVKKALDGLTVLQGNVNSVLDAVSGRAATGQRPDTQALAKAEGAANLDAIAADIEAAQDDGRLDAGGAMRARDLLGKFDAVAKGHLAKNIADSQLQLAPTAVRNIFESFLTKKAA